MEYTALDEKWYARLLKVMWSDASLAIPHHLIRKEKELFLAGKILNPRLTYTDTLQELQLQKESYDKFLDDLQTQESNSIVVSTYTSKIKNLLDQSDLLLAVQKGDSESFKKQTESIYGFPKKDIYNNVLYNIQREIEGIDTSKNKLLAIEIEKFRSLLNPKSENKTFDHPKTETVAYFKKFMQEQVGGLLDALEPSEIQNATQIKSSFNKALKQISALHWEAIIDTKNERVSIAVDSEKKKIYIPSNKEVTRERLAKLIVHEIGVHVTRSVNGEKSKLKLLAVGLGYGRGEEGIAIASEQALFKPDHIEYGGTLSYFVIGLVYGLDGTPKSFREVYETMKQYELIKSLARGVTVPVAEEKSKSTAWTQTLRVFRGTDGINKNVCYTKDLMYREGNMGIWDLIEKKPEEVERFFIGKYDPMNPKHCAVLDELGY